MCFTEQSFTDPEKERGFIKLCKEKCLFADLHVSEKRYMEQSGDALFWCLRTQTDFSLQPVNAHTHTYTHAKQSPTPIHTLTDGQDDGVM